MISLAIVGNGNVGFHLYKNLSENSLINVTQIDSRGHGSLEDFDISIIAVVDNAISEVSSYIKSPLVVHTSGTTHMNQLKNTTRKGVFYPLQSFSKDKEVDFSEIPFCLEAENPKDLEQLKELVNTLGAKPFEISSDQRKRIHVAAVFVNNFTNHLYKMAKDICAEHDVPFDILLPLIEETAKKVQTLSPSEAQTGPAIRNDEETIKNHLNLLNDSQKEIYQKLTASIQSHGKKL